VVEGVADGNDPARAIGDAARIIAGTRSKQQGAAHSVHKSTSKSQPGGTNEERGSRCIIVGAEKCGGLQSWLVCASARIITHPTPPPSLLPLPTSHLHHL